MKIFETDGKLKHCAILAVFVSLLVGGCSLFDNDNDDNNNKNKNKKPPKVVEKTVACQKAEEDYNNCLASGVPTSQCDGYRAEVRDACGY
jgi:protein involved in sex pheromone biosynthesis